MRGQVFYEISEWSGYASRHTFTITAWDAGTKELIGCKWVIGTMDYKFSEICNTGSVERSVVAGSGVRAVVQADIAAPAWQQRLVRRGLVGLSAGVWQACRLDGERANVYHVWKSRHRVCDLVRASETGENACYMYSAARSGNGNLDTYNNLQDTLKLSFQQQINVQLGV